MAITKGRFFPVQTIHYGPSGNFTTLFTALGSDGTVASGESGPFYGQLGMIVEDSGVVYKLVQIKNTTGVSSAAGDICYYKDTTFNVVTTKASESAFAANGVAGGTILTVSSTNSTLGDYMFIQIGGLQAAVATNSGSTVAGDMLVGDGSTDKQLDRIAAGSNLTNIPFAIAAGSASGGNNAASVVWLVGNLLR